MEGVYDFPSLSMVAVLVLFTSVIVVTILFCIDRHRRNIPEEEINPVRNHEVSDGETTDMSTHHQQQCSMEAVAVEEEHKDTGISAHQQEHNIMEAAVEDAHHEHHSKDVEKWLTEKDFRQIYHALWSARNKWYFIGIELDIDTSELDAIKIENSDVGTCLTKVISYWLRNYPNPSWLTLCNALEQPTVGYSELSRSIRSRYILASGCFGFSHDSCDTEDDIPSPVTSNRPTAFKCPCGNNCSFDDYLQMKCQDCNDSTMFPYLDVRHLDDRDRKRLTHKLCKDTCNIMRMFDSLYLDSVDSLETENINPATVARCISRSTDPHYPGSEQVNTRDIISDSIDSVFKSKSVEGSINFFNYHRLHNVVQRLGTDEDKDKFEQYLKEFQTFCKRSVFEVPSNVFGEAPPDSKKFAIKIFQPPKESNKWLTLNDVKRFQQMLADKLGIDICALSLHTVNKGCVQLQFWVPVHVANQNMDLTKYPTQLQIGEYNTQLLPGPPTKLRVEKNSENDVTLQWCKPEYGSHIIQRYQVLYKSEQLKTWKISETSGDTESITIPVTTLSSQGSLFTFKVHACSDVGEGVDSEEVEINLQDDILHSHDVDMDDPPPRQRGLPLPNVPLEAMADHGVDIARPPPTDDILHPLASLKWSECSRLPVDMRDAQAVWLEDKLYVGGGMTQGHAAKLYIYTPSTDTWSEMDTPVYYFALITYHSQLTLVGGMEHGDGLVTNKLWTLTSHDQWKETLLPMTVKRCGASAVEYAKNIIVAGGEDDRGRDIDIVEVYNGHHWTKAQCLPKPCQWMKSTVLSGHWYLMGGYERGKEVYCTSLASLIASCQLSEKPLPSVWKRLTNVPHVCSSPAVFGSRLIAVGGGYSMPTSSIHAYYPHTQSWIHVGDMPIKLHSTCTVVLPTGRLMVIGGWIKTTLFESCVYQVILNVTSFEPDSQFTIEALFRLEGMGVTIFNKLEDYKQPLQSVIGIEMVDVPADVNSFSILNTWLRGHANLRPTWRHFFWALREIQLGHLADQIESYLSGASVEQELSPNLGPTPESEEPEGREEEDNYKGEEGGIP